MSKPIINERKFESFLLAGKKYESIKFHARQGVLTKNNAFLKNNKFAK